MIDGLDSMVGEIFSPTISTVWKVNEYEYEFELVGRKHPWRVAMLFISNFPYSLPTLVLRNKEKIGSVAHVDQSGTICLENSDSTITDHTQPVQILKELLENCVESLDLFELGVYQDELLDELEGYFTETKRVHSFYNPPEKTEWFYLAKRQVRGRVGINSSAFDTIPILLTARNGQPPGNFSNLEKLGNFERIKAIHVSLNKACLPPGGAEKIDSSYVTKICREMTARNKHRLQKLVGCLKDGICFFVLISMPRPSGGDIQLLLKFTSKKHLAHPLKEHNDNWSVDLFSISRLYSDYLLERGGAEISLQNKKVALIGCGSVGGEIACMLAKAGIGELLLVDQDTIQADNIHRHRLGGSSILTVPNDSFGKGIQPHKVSALKYQIEQDLPHIRVKAEARLFQKMNNTEILRAYDLVIISVGAPATSLIINEELIRLGVKNSIYAWNEASGCGGHSVLTGADYGCYECLFSDAKGIRFETSLTLVKPNQKTTKILTGCSGVFTPFAYLDSSRTAELAAQQAVDFLLHNKEPCTMSWKGNNRSGLETTIRFDTMPLKEELPNPKNTYCRVCNE